MQAAKYRAMGCWAAFGACALGVGLAVGFRRAEMPSPLPEPVVPEGEGRRVGSVLLPGAASPERKLVPLPERQSDGVAAREGVEFFQSFLEPELFAPLRVLVLEVSVMGPSGAPVVGAFVRATSGRVAPGEPFRAGKQAVSNSFGTVELHVLSSEEVTLVVDARRQGCKIS